MYYAAFNKDWFNKHQRKLIWLLNAPVVGGWFRKILRIQCDKVINRIEPNAYWFGASESGSIISVSTEFKTHWKYSKRLYYAFKPIWWAMHCWDQVVNFIHLPKLNLGFDTLTVYPDANTESSTVDGLVVYDTPGEGTWAAAHDATAGTSSNDSDAQGRCAQSRESALDNDFIITRGFFLFDTSALTSGATISAATFSLWGISKVNTDNDGTDYVNVYTTTPASNTALVADDFDQIGTTAQATAIDLGSITADNSVYTDWTLNATGRGNISLTSITKFGTREGHDAENVSIADNTGNYLEVYFADQTGTSNDPKLTITYTLAGGGSSPIPTLLLMGAG